MNDNNLNNNNRVTTYRATSNLNTAIENPQINVNSATGINIQGNGYNNYADNTIDNSNTEFQTNSYKSLKNNVNNNINNTSNDINNSVDNSKTQVQSNNEITNNNYDSSLTEQKVNYSYEPVMKEKKRANDNALSDTIHSKEFKIMIFIIFILVLFLLLMPYIYDFFRNLSMGITA